MKRENWGIHRLMMAAFLLICLVVVVGGRRKFYGPQTETAIGWDLEAGTEVIPNLDQDTVLRQVFYPQNRILNYLYLAVESRGETGSMIVTLLDEKERVISEQAIPCSEMVVSGAQGIYIQRYVTPGKAYSYTVRFEGVTDQVPQIQTASCVSEGELGDLYVNGEAQRERIYGLFVYQSSYFQCLEWLLCAFVTIVLLVQVLGWNHLPVWQTRLYPLFVLFHALVCVVLLETAAGTDIFVWGWRRVFYNVLLCSSVFLVLSILIWKEQVALGIGTVLCVIVGIAEYYILEFRGTPLVLSDLGSIGTAMEVGSAYHFTITRQMMSAVLVAAGLILAESRIRFVRYQIKNRVLILTGMTAVFAAGMIYLESLQLYVTGKNGGFFWNQQGSYKKYGYCLATYIYEKFQTVKEPEGYSKQEAEEILAQADERAKEALAGSEREKEPVRPNIIAIMNESLTDFASVGGVETEEPVLPFIDSLKENTIRGNMYVSVFGAGTANTEFEFLTGNATGFLPVGGIPYQAYIKKPLFSLASYLKDFDYTTFACHYAKKTNWNRDKVYPLLGFDRFEAIEEVRELDMIHGYPSDYENYKELLRNYEAWKANPDHPHFFCFNVTIQNHGGYFYGYDAKDAPKLVMGDMGNDVSEYLSIIRESDKAFEELVHYFEQEEEPTIILMFGDHWPRLNNNFINTLTSQAGKVGLLEKNQNKYVTPFILWANYDIPEGYVDKMSANYLSLVLLEAAGFPLNGYQTFLKEVAQEVPVINSLGYVDAQGNYCSGEENLAPPAAKLVKQYRHLQYGNVFDGLQVGN